MKVQQIRNATILIEFTSDPQVRETSIAYLRSVGPSYVFAAGAWRRG